MKKTLRLIGLCALVMLAAVSCKKNEEKNVTFQATLTQPSSDSKTHIDANNNLVWNSGDQIKVYTADNTEASAAVFSTTSNNTMTATFSGTLTESASYTAFYPAEGVTVSGSKILMPLNAMQTFVDGNMASGAYPMYATGTGETFTFHSPAGLLMLKFMGSGTIGSVELTDKNGANLAGNYEVDPANNTCTFVGNATTVTLNCGEGVALNTETETVMYFVLPAGVFDGGFTAVVKNTTGGEMYTLSTTRANLIVAEKILEMPTVNVAAISVTTGTAVAGDVPTTMTLNGSYSAPAGMSVSEVGFYFGQGAALTKYPATLNNPFSLVRDGLAEGTEYSYQAYAVNGSNEILGSVETFTTSVSFVAPTVTNGTAAVTSATTATAHVTLDNAGTGPVTEIGVCWGTTNPPQVNPSANNFAAATGHEVGTEYTVNIEGLTPETFYFVTGYAKVGDDYYYAYSGSSQYFTTPAEVSNSPGFTVSSDKRVLFATGNLQYTKSTGEWSFMAHQYDMVETQDQNVGTNYGDQDVISLFSWGASGYNHGASYYQPWKTTYTYNYNYYKAYGDASAHLYSQTGKADWGYNVIHDGDETYLENSWRTLTLDEWYYVFDTRETPSGIRFVNAQIEGTANGTVKGVILLPDNWDATFYTLNNPNDDYFGGYDVNPISVADWVSVFEANGAVFLPVAGGRNNTSTFGVGDYGYYWSSSASGSTGYAWNIRLGDYGFYSASDRLYKAYGCSVRLVRDIDE